MSQELKGRSLYALRDGARGHSSKHNMQDFASLCHEHDWWLRRKARRLCRTQSDAEDLVADVWLRVIERAPEWTSERVIHKAGWLLAMLHNRFRDQSRHRLTSSKLNLVDLEMCGPARVSEPAFGTRGEALLHLIDLLPPADQELLLADGRRSPGTARTDARTANLQRVKRHRLRRKLLQELSIMESADGMTGHRGPFPAATQEQRPEFSREADPTEEADHEP